MRKHPIFLAGLFLFPAVLFAGLWVALNSSAPAQAAPDATLPDLDVTFIERQPMYSAYCVDYTWGETPGMPGKPFVCPGTESERRWPEPGEPVTFTAHIVNKGDLDSPAFGYTWQIDGSAVMTGSLPSLAAGAAITTTYQWDWAHGLMGERLTGIHTVGFSADPKGLVIESFESNNTLVDRTDAVSFQIIITPEMMLAYNEPVTNTLPRSAEDWFQKQIRAMNQALNNAVYPATPAGAVTQVRINRFQVSDSYPNGDRSHDGGWFVDADYRVVSGYYDPITDIDWGWIHEMSHQMALIDHYQSNVLFPFNHVLNQQGLRMNIGFEWPSQNSIMFGGETSPYTQPWVYDSHSAGGAKSNFGYRNGFYGAYQFDIPAENYLQVLDNAGNPAAGVQLALYRKLNLPGVPADVDNNPEISGLTGLDGRFHLPNLTTNGGATLPTGHVLHDNPFGMVDIIGEANRYMVKLSSGEHEEFHWLDITSFNLGYWQGYTDAYTQTIQAHIPVPGAPSAPQNVAGKLQGSLSTIYWTPVSSPVVGYNVYRMTYPDYQYEKTSDLQTETFFMDDFWRSYYSDFRFYVVTAVDDQGRESAFSNPVWIPRLFNPVSLTVEKDGNTLVQDSGSFYNFPELSPSGRWLHTQPVTEFSAFQSHHFTLNPDGWLAVSTPENGPDEPAAIHLYNPQNEAGFAIGEHGAGKLQTPAGVAWWSQQGYSLQGPYSSDAHALLLSAFDGSFNGAQGEVGTPNGVTFTTGRYGQAALFDNDDVLTYSTAGNLLRTQGTIEFWVKPSWIGNDNQNHAFLEVGEKWENRILIMKDGANNLRFLTWDELGQEYGVHCWIGDWAAGEWRHVAAAWQNDWLMLAVDGIPCKSEVFSGEALPTTLSDTIYVGNSYASDQPAQAVLDDLRISDFPRFGNTEQLRILVADAAANQVLALDGLGNLVASFGTNGSGNNQFNLPRGLAIYSPSEVIVVDQGNNRLQVLGFDSNAFTYHRTLLGGFDQPTNAAVYLGWIVVADTGNDQVKVLDPSGNLATAYTEPDDALVICPFIGPQGVAVDPWGRILIADTGNSRLAWIIHSVLPENLLYLPLLRR
jgi:hypothetical protein